MIKFEKFLLEEKENKKESGQASQPREVAIQVGKADLEQQRDLLQNILKAIELDLDSVDVVIADTYQTLPNKRVVCFGLETTMNLYELHDQSDQKILFADSLTSIAGDRDKKVSLWENLQNFRNH